jgi:hypothetical protein
MERFIVGRRSSSISRGIMYVVILDYFGRIIWKRGYRLFSGDIRWKNRGL